VVSKPPKLESLIVADAQTIGIEPNTAMALVVSGGYPAQREFA
jgi:hypothetical protein